MKKTFAVLLTVPLLLTGCGTQEVQTEDIQSQYEQVDTAHMEAEITLHLAEENCTFVIACDYNAAGTITATVLEPESLEGLTASVAGDDLTVSYEGLVLPAGTLKKVCPANLLPFLLRSIACGYITETGEETIEELRCIRLTLDDVAKNGTETVTTVWLDRDSLIPRYAEVAGENGETELSMTMQTFSCTLMQTAE